MLPLVFMRTVALFTLSIVTLFSLLRLYQINSSFLFFNDPGRDLSVLQTWQQTGKPPLLGPQTSALPFNQSAVYFYMLYPFYLLTNHSVFSTIIANWWIHVLVFLGGVFLLRKNKKLSIAWLVTWFLLSIHPQFIIQHRFVWNPSFVGICILSAFFFFLKQLQQQVVIQTIWTTNVRKLVYEYRFLIGFSLCLSLATALSYSTLPVFIAFALIGLWLLQGRRLALVGSLILSLGVLNLPTVVFELRHGFVLTNMMLYGEKLAQAGTDLASKISSLDRYVVAGGRAGLWLLGLTFLGLVVAELFLNRKKLSKIAPFIIALSLLVLTTVITLLMPVSLHAHYIFGILTAGFLVVAFLRWQLALVFCAVAASIWLQPSQVSHYFQPTFRTVSESVECAEKVCNAIPEPIFVSVQAGYHPFHAGPEFKFLLGEAGCAVRSIDSEPTTAEYMAVFSDNSEYEHGKTAYNELTQFGKSEEFLQINCTDNLKVHILKR